MLSKFKILQLKGYFRWLTYWTECVSYFLFFLIKFLLDTCPFSGHLIPLFRTSGDISSLFQSQSEQPYSNFAEAYVIYFPWGSPLVWYLCLCIWPASSPHACFSRSRMQDLNHGPCLAGGRANQSATATRFKKVYYHYSKVIVFQ